MAAISELQKRGVNLVIGLPQILFNTQKFEDYFHGERSIFFYQSWMWEYPSNDCQVQTYQDTEMLPTFLQETQLTHFCFPQLPDTAKIVEIPINAQVKLFALYLTPHPALEHAIQYQGWQTF